MNNRKQTSYRRPSKFYRIERKCDRILSELLIIRQQLSRHSDIDASIERMHVAARKLREQCEYERLKVRQMFNSKHAEE